MKSVQQIIEYINRLYEFGTENPQGYFRNLESMEEQLFSFESLYEFIIDDSREGLTHASGFIDFSHDEGYGTLGYSHGKLEDDGPARPPVPAPSADEVTRMKEFGEFWRRYLSSGRRLTATATRQAERPSP